MPASDGGWVNTRPASESLKERNRDGGNVRCCRGRYGDLTAAAGVFDRT